MPCSRVSSLYNAAAKGNATVGKLASGKSGQMQASPAVMLARSDSGLAVKAASMSARAGDSAAGGLAAATAYVLYVHHCSMVFKITHRLGCCRSCISGCQS